MGKLLIIPDVHEDIEGVKRIFDKFSDVPKLWLGDFFDSFDSTEKSTQATCKLLNEILERGDLMCIGNHDVHYMFSNAQLRSSGYSMERREIIHSNVDVDYWRRHALLFHVREGYYLSHAGFHPSWFPNRLNAEERLGYLARKAVIAVDEAVNGKYPSLLHAGYARGGPHLVGGPTWMDWSDFEEIPTMPQIVGHTKRAQVRQKGESYCIDTQLKHVALIEDGKVEIVEVKEAQ